MEHISNIVIYGFLDSIGERSGKELAAKLKQTDGSKRDLVFTLGSPEQVEKLKSKLWEACILGGQEQDGKFVVNTIVFGKSPAYSA